MKSTNKGSHGFFHCLHLRQIQKNIEDSLCNTEHTYYPWLDYEQQNHWALAYTHSNMQGEKIDLHMYNLFLEDFKQNPKKVLCRTTYIITHLKILFTKVQAK